MFTQVQFGYITVNGQQIPVKFGTATSKTWCDIMSKDSRDKGEDRIYEVKDFTSFLTDKNEEGKTKLETSETTNVEIMALVYAALYHGHRVEKKPFDLDLDGAGDFIDVMNKTPDLWKDLFKIIGDGVEVEQAESPNEPTKTPLKVSQ